MTTIGFEAIPDPIALLRTFLLSLEASAVPATVATVTRTRSVRPAGPEYGSPPASACSTASRAVATRRVLTPLRSASSPTTGPRSASKRQASCWSLRPW